MQGEKLTRNPAAKLAARPIGFEAIKIFSNPAKR
jgi:hypothetical protein